ncbi:MAG: PAS domain-containing protein [Candidatus Omnitrophica bacterium]|nr:PAS domain-containing protein [Candidatus Omnitrophota bacterium]
MSSLMWVYVLTGIVSVVIALLLVRLTHVSGQVNPETGPNPAKTSDSHLPASERLQKIINEEISKVAGSEKRSREIGSRITSVFTDELNQKIEQNKLELRQKYEAVIDRKTENEAIAWKKYKKIINEKKQTEAVIRSIAEGLVVVDAQGKVVMINPAAEKLLGVSRQDKVGKSLTEDMKDEQLVSLSQGSPDKEEKEIELTSRQDATKKVLRASTAVIENENGQTVGMVSVLSDITKQKELDNLKSAFVANVSHELRTPLVAIDKSLTLILEKEAGELSQTQEQFLSIARRNLKRLSALINDLLDLSKLEAGKMEVRRKRMAINNVIQEVIDSLNNWARSKNITLEKRIEDMLPDVEIDPDRLAQVITNLVGNAVKFTPNDGKITLEAKLSDGKKELEVSVKDTGIGIAPEDLPKIFSKFYQCGGERMISDVNGTGIGLSIAKEIVELHGGRIWVESEKGQGARFIFTIPLTSIS